MPKELAMMLQTDRPLILIVRGTAGQDAILTDQTAVHFTVPDLASEFGVAWGRFAALDDGRMRFEQADHLFRGRHRLALEHAARRLRDDPLRQGQKMFQGGHQRHRLQVVRPIAQQAENLLGIILAVLGHADQFLIQAAHFSLRIGLFGAFFCP